MVTDSGILYTIEGLAAGVLMITTVYLVVSSTMVFTPGDTHIIDMQLEQLGNDVLAIMDTPVKFGEPSPLELYVMEHDITNFSVHFLLLANTASQPGFGKVKFNSTIYYRKGANIGSYHFTDSGDIITGREHMVKVTRRVFVADSSKLPSGPDIRPQSVLMEVTLWRD